MSQGTGYAREYDYQTNSNRLDKLKQNWGGAAASGFEARLTYDTLGRRDTEKTQAASYMALLNRSSEAGVDVDFSYTDPVAENHIDRSELRSSGKYVMDSNWSVGGLRGKSEGVRALFVKDLQIARTIYVDQNPT